MRGFRRTGARIDRLAQHYGISRRSVFRALRRQAGGNNNRTGSN
jgi:hypothetical protein